MARQSNQNAFPLNKDGAGLSSGTHSINDGQVLLCISDGSVAFTWEKGGTYTEAMTAGSAYELTDVASLTISGGLFHIG